MTESTFKFGKAAWALIIIASLGYFVDVYDLLVFSAVRSASLTSIGVASKDLLSVGLNLLNWQAGGLIVGGILWGILGDRKGRKTVLFGSIALYSIANICNMFVATVGWYEVFRFLAGLGLAGELGAGITLASELVSKEKRGIATMLIAGVGLLGAIAASLVALNCSWQTAFLVGGIGGIVLLALRATISESSMFKKVSAVANVQRGNFLMLFNNWKRFKTYILAILSGAAVYFIVGILITAAPEFGKNEGLSPAPLAAIAIMVCYIGGSIGDILCSTFSQVVRSRKKAMVLFNIISLLAILFFVLYPSPNLTFYYFKSGLLGLGFGFWAVMNTTAAEHFGTNLRATVASTVPNFVRGLLIPMTVMFTYFRGAYGLSNGALITGVILSVIAIIASSLQSESFHKDLDYVDM